MSRIQDLVILLPARNEADGIGEVIDRIPQESIISMGYNPRVVVSDGHSSDSTREISRSKGALILEQKGEVGKGNGVREAIEYVFSSPEFDVGAVIMLDADATYRPEDIPLFLRELRTSDVVWGSRLRGEMEEKAMSRINRIGNILLSMSASIMFLKRTTDLCTGYWCFKNDAITKLPLTASGFNLEADMFASVCKSRLSSREIAINYDHREGESNLKWYRDGPRIFFMVLKKRFFLA